MDLRNLDLNLLLLFDALYQHRSVGRAAEALFLSQSACSHALSRLRSSLNDELFVRVNNEMVPTARAERLALKVSQALTTLREGLADSDNFDAANSERTFVFSATDYTALTLLPGLMARLATEAPGVRVKVIQSGQKLPLAQLESGEVDFALGFTHEAEHSSIVDSQNWLRDSYCVLARQGHPAVQGELTLDTYLAQQHILVAPWNESMGIVDHSLKAIGRQRDIGLQVPDVMVSPFVVAETDLLVTFPARMAGRVLNTLPLQVLAAPFELPDYQLKYYWHRLRSGDSAYRWMCTLLAEIAAEYCPPN